MCISKIKTFRNNRNNMNNIVLNIGCLLRTKGICNEEENNRPMTDKRFLK